MSGGSGSTVQMTVFHKMVAPTRVSRANAPTVCFLWCDCGALKPRFHELGDIDG